jgi:hypothetical protein
VNLNESQQQAVIDFVMAVAYDLTDNGYVKKNLTDIDIDASIEEYRRSLELQKKVRDGSSA